MTDYQFCILNEEKDIIDFEKGLFHSYSKKDPGGWIFNHYKKIGNCRLRPTIPYEKQVVYGIKKNNKLIAGSSINFYEKENMQIFQMGFTLKEKINENYSEGLNFYMLENEIGNDNFLSILSGYFENIIQHGISENYYIGFATCSKKLKPLYELEGWQVIEEKMINGELRYLLKLNSHK